MKELNIRRARVDEEVIAVSLDHDQVHELLTRAVAEAAGVGLSGKGVSVTRCHVSTSSSMSSGTRVEAFIEIRIDQSKLDQAG